LRRVSSVHDHTQTRINTFSPLRSRSPTWNMVGLSAIPNPTWSRVNHLWRLQTLNQLSTSCKESYLEAKTKQTNS
jgi:uncharacterized pyridoxal phosphate-containing UPF0001 family protein